LGRTTELLKLVDIQAVAALMKAGWTRRQALMKLATTERADSSVRLLLVSSWSVVPHCQGCLVSFLLHFVCLGDCCFDGPSFFEDGV
jgi:hypothetical protein